MQHLQMRGVREQLRTRGMAIRSESGNFHVFHVDRRYPEVATRDDLFSAYTAGLRMASERDRSKFQAQGVRHVRH
jgi:hypothetical protein